MEFDLARLQPKERASFALRALYEAAGCRKYHMGRFEEYGLYQENRSFLSSEQVITFTDLDGRLLALKPDVTLSIAKTAQPAPGETLKYYYHENVYRPSAESHTFKEISQMGLELLGEVKEPEVRQTVCLAARSLEQMGQPWVLEISHMGYLFGLFDALGVPEAARPGLLETLRAKNIHELRAAAKAAGLSDADANALTALLSLSGEYAVALPKAAALCRNARMEAAVAELNALAEPLAKAGGSIRLDLTLAGEMEYYNGLIFQGYLRPLPRPLLKGGRYDLLMQKFTPGADAIGFAVYLDELDRLSAPLPPVQQQNADQGMLNVALPRGAIEGILKANPNNVVIVDEAYVDFGGESCVPLIDQYENLLVIQTFSKSRQLAGARLGLAMGNAKLIADLNRVKFSLNPYNINRLTLKAGEAALNDTAYFDKTRAAIIETRAWTKQQLEARGFTCLDSRSNFLFASTERKNGAELYKKLKEKGVLVRHFNAPRTANWLRVTIGTPEEMQALLAALDKILEE